MADGIGRDGVAHEDESRLHDSPLARYEGVALDWFVRRLPGFVTPDLLTAFGIFGAFFTFLGYALCEWSDQFLWLASAGLAMNWFGDSLDGSLARYRSIERPRYGFFLDQNIDVFGNLLIGGGLAASPFIRVEPAALAIIGYQALTIYVLIRLRLDGVFRVTVLNSGPTEMRLLLVLMNCMILLFGAPLWTLWGLTFAWCDVTVGLFGIGFLGVFAYLIMSEGARLRIEDDLARVERDVDALDDSRAA